MTTVAWDGKMLAADSMAVSGGNLKRRVVKLFRLKDGRLFGGAGEWDSVLKAIEWLNADEKPAKPSLHDSFSGLIIGSTGCCKVESALIPTEVFEPFIAIGSGRDFAIAAMHLGKSAREALELTLLYDANTGGPIDVMTWSQPHLQAVG